MLEAYFNKATESYTISYKGKCLSVSKDDIEDNGRVGALIGEKIHSYDYLDSLNAGDHVDTSRVSRDGVSLIIENTSISITYYKGQWYRSSGRRIDFAVYGGLLWSKHNQIVLNNIKSLEGDQW